ncbi:MAG: hypothetical protein WAM56_12800 [Acidobacteriaceae bacterium]
MNQQQLQTARAALWRHSAPLLTADEAATWLEDLGLCLFLPRHAQLPAPAPSFVEAVHGAASAAPPAAALEHASELMTRLVQDDRIVPLNLLGTYSEQADFLITPEVLPWVAAARGDRQWNSAPGGRTAPLVVRTWQILDREGEATAVQLRELLGRELTEAAVLRALTELWTTVRAIPLYKPGAPARWTLLKNRFPTQLTTGANTAQTTALSALLSIYLRSAVAATAEEAEIFLSPLTARSRIREVIHGMMAARQFGTMSVASQTLLFVEGSLPENLPIEEAKPAGAVAPLIVPPAKRAQRAPAPPYREEFQNKREPAARPDASRRERQPSFQERPEKRAPAKPWQRRPAFRGPDRPTREERPSAASRPGPRGEKRPSTQFRPGARGDQRPGARLWERRPAFDQQDRPAGERQRPSAAFRSGPRGEKRPSTQFRPGARGDQRPGARPWQRRPAFDQQDRPTGEKQRPSAAFRPGPRGEKRPSTQFRPGPRGEKRSSAAFRPEARGEKRPETRPGQRRPAAGDRREDRRRFDREAGERRPRFEGEKRAGQKSGQKFGQKAGQKPGFGTSGPQGFGRKKPRTKAFGGPRPKFPAKREGAAAGTRVPGRDLRPRFGKPQRREDSGRPFAQNKNFKGAGKKNFGKANPGKRNPRKNRSQEENPE